MLFTDFYRFFVVGANAKNYEIEVIGNTKPKANRKVVVGEVQQQDVVEEYNYLDCSIYTVENLIGRKSL